MKKKLFFSLFALVCALCCAFGLTACVNAKPENTTIAVTEVTLNTTELILDVGDEEVLTATVIPDDATNKAVIWSVTPAGIVTVDNGKVTAVAEGEATVTATADGKSGICTVKVNAATPSVSYEVTKSEWQAALSKEAFTNFTASLTQTGYDGVCVLMADLENNRYFYDNSRHVEIFYSKEGDKYYRYRKGGDESEFTRIETTQSEYENKMYQLEWLMALELGESYSSFNYNQDDNIYSGPFIPFENADPLDIELKFENGKLIYMSIDFGNAVQKVNYVHGATVITLPADYIESNS